MWIKIVVILVFGALFAYIANLAFIGEFSFGATINEFFL